MKKKKKEIVVVVYTHVLAAAFAVDPGSRIDQVYNHLSSGLQKRKTIEGRQRWKVGLDWVQVWRKTKWMLVSVTLGAHIGLSCPKKIQKLEAYDA